MTKFLDWYKTEHAEYAYKKYASPSSKNLKAFFDEYRLSQITLMLIEKYKKTRKAAGKSNVTVNRELMLLRHMFNKCIAFKMARFNPFRTSTKLQDGTYHEDKVKLFKEAGRERYLSEEEAEKLIEACNEDLRLVVRLAMGTGFRSKEIKTLTWANLDLVEGTATVTSAYSKNGDTDTVPLPDDLIAAFRTLKDEQKPKEHDRVFTRNGKRPGRTGERLSMASWNEQASRTSTSTISDTAMVPGWLRPACNSRTARS